MYIICIKDIPLKILLLPVTHVATKD